MGYWTIGLLAKMLKIGEEGHHTSIRAESQADEQGLAASLVLYTLNLALRWRQEDGSCGTLPQ